MPVKHANQTYGFVTNPSQTYSNNVKNRRRGNDAGRDLEDGEWWRGKDSLAPRESEPQPVTRGRQLEHEAGRAGRCSDWRAGHF